MPRKRHSAEEIIAKLRQADMLLARGRTGADVVHVLGVTGTTYYRWRSEFGGLKGDQLKRLRELGQENTWLRKAAAGLMRDKLIMKEAGKGNFFSIRGAVKIANRNECRNLLLAWVRSNPDARCKPKFTHMKWPIC